MKRSANFSRCKQYRYALWRWWGDGEDYALIIGLNPSTADHKKDDPTIRRCINFARDWGYSGLCVANLFAFRATYPQDLFAADDPVGPHNDRWLHKLAADAQIIVGGWGNHGTQLGRADQIRSSINNIHILKLNTSGEPAHPLYLRKNLKPKKWAYR